MEEAVNKIRLTMVVSPSLERFMRQDAHERGLSLSQYFERAVRIVGAARDQRKLGRAHMGFVADPTKLDAEFIM